MNVSTVTTIKASLGVLCVQLNACDQKPCWADICIFQFFFLWLFQNIVSWTWSRKYFYSNTENVTSLSKGADTRSRWQRTSGDEGRLWRRLTFSHVVSWPKSYAWTHRKDYSQRPTSIYTIYDIIANQIDSNRDEGRRVATVCGILQKLGRQTISLVCQHL